MVVVVVITCVGIIITMHPSTVPFAPPTPTPDCSPNQKLQRRVLLSRAVQEKMAAVSRSCLHICQELTVQEKMGSVVCRVFFLTSFYSSLHV